MPKKIPTALSNRVHLGIGVLDAEDQENLLNDVNWPTWRGKINAAELDMGNPWKCVLGQLYGDYSDGLERLGIPPEQSYIYGFNADWSASSRIAVPGYLMFRQRDDELRRLNALWAWAAGGNALNGWSA